MNETCSGHNSWRRPAPLRRERCNSVARVLVFLQHTLQRYFCSHLWTSLVRQSGYQLLRFTVSRCSRSGHCGLPTCPGLYTAPRALAGQHAASSLGTAVQTRNEYCVDAEQRVATGCSLARGSLSPRDRAGISLSKSCDRGAKGRLAE